MDLSGVGTLWLNGQRVLSNARYRLRIEQRGVMGHIDGNLDIDPIHDGLRLMTMKGIADPNSDLVLELEDGSRWSCVLKNNEGTLLNRGGIQPPNSGGPTT